MMWLMTDYYQFHPAAVFIAWVVAACSDMFACLLLATLFYRAGGPWGKLLAGAWVGVALEACWAALSLLLFFPTEMVLLPYFAISRMVFRSIKAIVLWNLALQMLFGRRRSRSGWEDT